MLRVGEHAHIRLVTVIPTPSGLRLASPDWIVFHCALDKVIYQDGTCQLQASHLCPRHKVT